MLNPKNRTEIDHYEHQLKKKYGQAKIFAETIDRCRENILAIRNKLSINKNNTDIFEMLNSQLISQQEIYGDCITQLEELKRETRHLRYGLEQAKIKALKKFRSHCNNAHVLQNISNINEKQNFTTQTEVTDRTEGEKSYFRFNNNNNLSNSEENNDALLTGLTKINENYTDSSETIDKVLTNLELETSDTEVNLSPSKSVVVDTDSTRSDDSHNRKKCDASDSVEKTSDVAKTRNYFNENDGSEFIEFMKTIPLTGDEEIDEEIFNFYRNKFNNTI